jgi:hypothetical protein
LQERKSKRGGIAQIKKLDYMIKKAVKLGIQVPVLADHLQVLVTKKAAPRAVKEILESKTINVSNYMEMICSCTTRELVLDAEEANLGIYKCGGCQTIKSRREYGELGFVEKQKSCICCFKVASDLSPIPGMGDMVPGCPCTNRSQVNVIVQELRERMSARGQVGQMKKQEKLLGIIRGFQEELHLIGDHVGASFPPPQSVMAERFGNNPPVLKREVCVVEETVEPQKYTVTNYIDSCLNCFCTCGIAGCTTETVELEADDMYLTTKNRLDDSNMKMPYAELDSVDVNKTCCCCWTVNDISPGCGCSRKLTEEIAAELQDRKQKRGNIAHLKQLRHMQSTTAGLNLLGAEIIEKAGVQFPPTQPTIFRVFQGKTPRALTAAGNTVHIEAEKEFETRSFSVTNYPESIANLLCSCCLAGWRTRKIELTPEEMLILTEDCCSRTQSRTPYGNLDSVETETTCCCCSELPDVATPGCGCSKDLVNEIEAELQERKVKRGAIAQMKQQENIITEILSLGVTLDLLLDNHGIFFPPSQEVMQRVFVQ